MGRPGVRVPWLKHHLGFAAERCERTESARKRDPAVTRRNDQGAVVVGRSLPAGRLLRVAGEYLSSAAGLNVVALPIGATKLWFWSFNAYKLVPPNNVRTKVEPSAPFPRNAVGASMVLPETAG
jgi:hypothetical protein